MCFPFIGLISLFNFFRQGSPILEGRQIPDLTVPSSGLLDSMRNYSTLGAPDTVTAPASRYVFIVKPALEFYLKGTQI